MGGSLQAQETYACVEQKLLPYVEVNTPSIVEDIDSPEDYLKSKP